jgi:predicted transposase YdaD
MKHLEALNISESMLESAYLEGQAVSFETGKVEGKLEGMRAAQRSMVKSAAERGLAVDIIASIVDVSVEEVQRILESNDGQ